MVVLVMLMRVPGQVTADISRLTTAAVHGPILMGGGDGCETNVLHEWWGFEMHLVH